MAQIQLIIKGSPEQAERAAWRHGLKGYRHMNTVGDSVRAFVDNGLTATLAVTRWFVEHTEPPFKPGELLHYTLPASEWPDEAP